MAMDSVPATRRRGRRNGNTRTTQGTTAMEGAMAMDGALGSEKGANWDDIVAEAV